MTTGRTVEAKVGDWLTVFKALQPEITPEAFRVFTVIQPGDSIESINMRLNAARIVFANDRNAAMVAALLTANGIKPIAVGDVED